MMRFLLAPLALVFRIITLARGWFYDFNIFPAHAIPLAKVVVIGNITAGGTGKTPLTALLAWQLREQGLRVGIVSRGYKGTYKGIAKVPSKNADSKIYGDEPSWMAQELGSETPVYVARKRVEAARAMAAKENVQVILADDAFQHRRLKRDFNIVIIDATEPLWHYRALPWGRARESFGALKRADAVVLNKINFVDAKTQQLLRERIQANLKAGVKIIALAYGLSGLTSLANDGEWPVTTLNELKVFLVSALGRPESFEALVRDQAGKVTGHLAFDDHHAYSKRDIKDIESQARAAGADAIVVTQKDAVKLRGSMFNLPVFVTCLDLQGSGRDQLVEALRTKIL